MTLLLGASIVVRSLVDRIPAAVHAKQKHGSHERSLNAVNMNPERRESE